MAHMEKFQLGSVSAMIDHYRRARPGTLARSNIDPERTHLNYVLGPDHGKEEVERRIAEVGRETGRAVRRDAVVMADWVVTAPPDLRHGDERAFFEAAYDFVAERYGRENVLGGHVHMDEATPHIHIPITPIVTREDGTRSFCAKEMFDRADLRTFHQGLSDRIEERLGYRTQILLREDQVLRRALSRVDGMDAFQKAKDRLERLRSDEREAHSRNRELREALAARKGEERRAVAENRERSQEARALQEEVRRAEREHSRLERVRDELVERVGRLRQRIREAAERVRGALGGDARDAEKAVRLWQEARGRTREARAELRSARSGADDGPRRELEEARRELDAARDELRKAEGREREADRRLRRHEEHRLRYRSEIKGDRQRLDEARERVRDLEEGAGRAERRAAEAERRSREHDERERERLAPLHRNLERARGEEEALLDRAKCAYSRLSDQTKARIEERLGFERTRAAADREDKDREPCREQGGDRSDRADWGRDR